MEKLTNNFELLMSDKEDKELFIRNQIINFLYYEFDLIDIYSTNDIERIISYCKYNKEKVLSVLETYTRDELMKILDDKDLENLKRSQSEKYNYDIDINIKQQKKIINYYIKLYKEDNKRENENENKKIHEHEYENEYQNKYNNINSNNYIENPWDFISKNVHLIDMKDLMNNYDEHKLIQKANTTVKDKDVKKIEEFYKKFYEEREQKMREIFTASLEDNDILYLHEDEMITYQYEKNLEKKMNENNYKGNIKSFNDKFRSCSTYLKIQILDFCDIFSVGKFGLVNKNFYEFVYKHYHFEKISKNYCMAIFKNSNLYINQAEKIDFKNYFMMLKNRPRIYFSGVYYCRVKFNKNGEHFGKTSKLFTVFYYRILRFFPNGEVHSITCPHIKNKQLLKNIKNKSADIKKGRFYIDEDSSITINIQNDETSNNIYKYKVKDKYLI
jgi:hypothetical protein